MSSLLHKFCFGCHEVRNSSCFVLNDVWFVLICEDTVLWCSRVEISTAVFTLGAVAVFPPRFRCPVASVYVRSLVLY